MEYDYQEIIDNCKKLEICSYIPVFDFRGKSYAGEFLNLFNFYQENIVRHYKYGIKPGIFVFGDNDTLNAWAAKISETYVISFNRGTVFRLEELFRYNTTILDSEGLESYQEVENHSNYKFHNLMHQICMSFTFYHELGHLIQKSDGLNLGLNEDLDRHISFDFQRHVLEYDADFFSAMNLGAHIYQYFEKWHKRKTSNDLECLISILSAAIFVRILSSPSMDMPFYTNENSHPHPIIRVLSIVHAIIDYNIELLERKESGVTIDEGRVVKMTLAAAEILAKNLLGNFQFKNFVLMLQENEEKISEYTGELREQTARMGNSAYNRWNKMANRIN
ncbi:MAG: hypothetical protein IPG12_07055 [Saprospiraceae bacterium]|nr:hypothetical protein [Saprospiraceae bacterium]